MVVVSKHKAGAAIWKSKKQAKIAKKEKIRLCVERYFVQF